jgi:hypothetical protein
VRVFGFGLPSYLLLKLLIIFYTLTPLISHLTHINSNELTNEMFLPGYASVGGMLEGPTLAKTSGVKVGDFIIAINGVL